MNKQKDNNFFKKVLTLVEQIPAGKVCTYGIIAEKCGMKSGGRMVAWALNAQKNNDKYPCHRVVNRNGDLSGAAHFPTPTQMADLLGSEGVEVIESRVDLGKYLFTPK
jgi:methylated-DNA-protein-cysteine methyltransferase related protein